MHEAFFLCILPGCDAKWGWTGDTEREMLSTEPRLYHWESLQNGTIYLDAMID